MPSGQRPGLRDSHLPAGGGACERPPRAGLAVAITAFTFLGTQRRGGACAVDHRALLPSAASRAGLCGPHLGQALAPPVPVLVSEDPEQNPPCGRHPGLPGVCFRPQQPRVWLSLVRCALPRVPVLCTAFCSF